MVEELPSGQKITGQMIKPSGFENLLTVLTFLPVNADRALETSTSSGKPCFLLHMKVVCSKFTTTASPENVNFV